jgi:hypothetical protein
MNPVAQKYNEMFQPVSNDALVMSIGDELSQINEKEFKEAAIEDVNVGRCIFYKSDKDDSLVFELIGGTIKSDSIASLYKSNSIFTDRARYVAARLDLIREVARLFGAGENYANVAVKDHSRDRMVLLSELGTAQLLDIINDSERRIQLPR